MKRILLLITLILSGLGPGLAQSQDLEKGTTEDLRAVTKVHLSPPFFDMECLNKIVETVRKKAPKLTFVAVRSDADVGLVFSMTLQTNTYRIPGDTPGGPSRSTNEIIWELRGHTLRFLQGGGSRTIKEFTRKGSDRKALAEKFAEDFVKTYLAVNPTNQAATSAESNRNKPNLVRQENPPDKGINRNGESLATTRPKETPEDDVLRIDTSLVVIHASVTDRQGRPVTNLRREDFSIFENDLKQNIAFVDPVDKPFTVALLIDLSDSTRSRMKEMLGAINIFIDRLRLDDQVMAITFDNEIKEILKPANVGEVRGAGINVVPEGGSTRLYDAVDFVMKKYRAGPTGRKVVVLLTDGVDGESFLATLESNLRDVQEADVLFYVIRYDTYAAYMRSNVDRFGPRAKLMSVEIKKQYERGDAYLQSLAERSGGHLFRADNIEDLPAVFASIIETLGRQYSLGYYSTSPPVKEEQRTIKVRVGSPGLVVKARDRYTAKSPTAQRDR